MDLFTGAMSMLPFKVLELLKQEYKLQEGVQADVESLSRELESMYASLRKVAAVPWEQLDDQVKHWASEVREASYVMEDVIDTFIIRVGPEPTDTRLLKKMGKLFHISKGKARHDIAGAIEGIKKQLRQMSERRDRYKIDDIVARPATRANVDPRLSVLYTKASELVGIDEPRDELIRRLSIGDSDDKETKIVSIVGFGGLGKTTLAKAVYDKVNLQFDCWAIVPVGQNPEPRKVLRDIINDIRVNKSTNIIFDHDKTRSTLIDPMALDERQLINILREHLHGKRYLIVLDDIWEKSTWEVIKNAFVDSNSGSRIITTSRISHVSTEIGEVYKMEELSDMNSKKLFYRKTFRGEENHHFTAELDVVSDKIIRKCHGVPLAIVTIASVLANKQPEEWSSVYQSIGFGPDGDEKVENMKKILSFSYYDMPCYLRTCLLYLSIFLEEYTISERDLILRWMAEGFIQEENGKEFFDTGVTYLHELIDRSMVIPIEEKGSGLLFGCRVHDMVLRLIRELSSKENFLLVLKGEQRPTAQNNIRRLSLQMLKDVEIKNKNMVQVRSFNVTICHTNELPQLSRFKVLRVLVLEFCISMEGYPLEHIANLLHLRYLRIAHTPARKLTEKIGRLKFLQTLILDDTGIEELPVSVRKLTQLMCLRVDKKMSVPEWIGELTSLVELEMYHEVLDSLMKEPFSVVGPEMYRGVRNKCSTSQFVKELGKLRNLRVLKTGINLQNEGQGRDLLESLRNMEKIQVIDISLPSVFSEMDVARMGPRFALSSSLRVLDLFNPQFSRLPAWINAQDLPNLCQLTVVVQDEDEKDLTILGKFRGLRKLVLVVVRVHRLKLAVCGCDGFQKLRSFDVTEPLKFEHGVMPRLESTNFSIPVAELKDASIGLEFGLENLSALRSVSANLDCTNACETEVHEAEAMLKQAVDVHPNHPALEVRRTDEDKMEPEDAGSRTVNQLMYKVLKATTLSADIVVQQDLYSALYNEAAEMARSMPKDHPSVAKIALLQKQIADPVKIMGASDVPWDLAELMEMIQSQERLLETYSVEIPRVATIVEELKAGLIPQQAEDDGVDKIHNDHVAEEKGERVSQASAVNGGEAGEEHNQSTSAQEVSSQRTGVSGDYSSSMERVAVATTCCRQESSKAAAPQSPAAVPKDLPPVAEEKPTNSPAVSTTDLPPSTPGGNNSPLVDIGSLTLAHPRQNVAAADDDDFELDYSMFDDVEVDEDLTVPEAMAFTDEMSASRSRALQDLYNALTSQGARARLLAGSSDLQSMLTDAAPLLKSKTIAAIQQLLRLPNPEVDEAQERLTRREIQEHMLRVLTADAKAQKQRHDELVSACKENASLVQQEKAKFEELKKALSLAEKNVDRLTDESAKLKTSLAHQRKSMMDTVAAQKAQKANIIPGTRAEDEDIIASVDRTIAAATLAVVEEMGSSK